MRLIPILAFAAAAIASATSGAAAVFTATFSGTVGGALDGAGLFGPPSTSLSGKAATVRLRIDTGVPGLLDIHAPAAEYFYSGSYFGGLPTAIDATLTIDGRSVALTGNYKGSYFQENGFTPLGRSGNGDQLLVVVDEYNNSNKEYEFSISIGDNFSDNFLPTDSISASGHYHFGPSGYQDNRFSFFDTNINSGAPIAYGSLRFTDLVVIAGGVPEPAAWSLMLGGFGLTGAAMRRCAATSAQRSY